MTAIQKKVRDIVGTSFGVDPATLSDQTRAQDVEGWDSLAHATLILRLQKHLRVRLDPQKANTAQNLGLLIALIEQAVSRNA